ncbi:aspartyl protease family protein [Nonomuraea roseoviolacea]|uniref:Tetratricopeptide (TPR) repeat protein n=1 Tax=Nonomuraea roseoviolacea subsp. carminata TaxID=160689 RepID=A0ABT1JZF9_9ACTN|nr:aspartyl protease family protein [Nonomuraea roseoviolacea]MCP2347132.1 tetratricopeptide (TPR) repeat protein [Nonomuraea roseoviolacea subsp. carminata]
MTSRDESQTFDRRTLLRGAGLAAAMALPIAALADASAAARAMTPDELLQNGAATPDELFRNGEFAEAARGYRRRLHDDPEDAHAAARLGYIALLSNRFGPAETFLSRAVDLDPGDVASRRRLAECFVRQDRHARAVPLLRQTGDQRDAAFARLTGTPWRIEGAAGTRVPFHTLDPVPSVEAALNGGPGRKFLLDTYGTLDLSAEAAEEAGLRALATVPGGVADNKPVTIYLGVLDSLRIGRIEIRDLPVQWIDMRRPPLPDGSQPAGVIGTTVFYHFLTTMDYADRALVLRRRTEAQRRRFQARARRSGASVLPLWLAGDHYPCTLGAVQDSGPRMVTLDMGGIGHGLDTTAEIAERLGIAVDRDHPLPGNGPTLYPITAERISLGRASGRDVRGHAAEKVFPGFPGPGQSAQFGFDLLANITHEFFKPYAITFDYGGMDFYVAGG